MFKTVVILNSGFLVAGFQIIDFDHFFVFEMFLLISVCFKRK